MVSKWKAFGKCLEIGNQVESKWLETTGKQARGKLALGKHMKATGKWLKKGGKWQSGEKQMARGNWQVSGKQLVSCKQLTITGKQEESI